MARLGEKVVLALFILAARLSSSISDSIGSSMPSYLVPDLLLKYDALLSLSKFLDVTNCFFFLKVTLVELELAEEL